ncbi:MAG TPA: N,N-dimethylformamidase beta subunit family domain-containing protein [Myxococcales bacterium]|nr:N,N-dimethylformamidase beta subunit family domain-containing protein [Myxococcales bacterium]
MRGTWLAVSTALLACSGSGGNAPVEPPRASHTNPIPAENSLPGDPNWAVVKGDGSPSGAAAARRPVHVEAYADHVSANAGDTIQVMANIPLAAGGPMGVHWALYRIGWYGGAGARKLTEGSATAGPQPSCPVDAATGFIQCRWSPTFSVVIPQDAVSGLYLVRILRDEQFPWGTYVPLVVKDDRPSDLYFQSSVTTYQAYNRWMDESLYDDDLGLTSRFAVKVGWDRPYIMDYGAGQMLRYEAHMASFLERSGYDVSYTTNLDVVREGGAGLVRHGAFLSVGHDEYWDGKERDAVEAARDAGVHVFFFGANAAYWKVRLGDPGPDGNARSMTCYKIRPKDDPLAADPVLRTGRYRDDPITRPEEELVGTMYEEQVLFGHAWVVRNSSSFAYQGTGFHDGDLVPGLVGYEYDRTFANNTPGAGTLLARSPLVDIYGRPGTSDAVVYRAPSGALVFGAGSIYFPLALDDFAYGPYHGQRDPRMERFAANLFNAALNLPVPPALSNPRAPLYGQPAGRWVSSVATLANGLAGADGRGGPSSVAQLPDGSFVYADPRHHQIGRIGQTAPYAGTGIRGFDNQPVAAASAHFANPSSLWADPAGNVYVADTLNSCIRRIGNDPDHSVTVFAGTCGSYGFQDGAGGAARFSNPMGLAFSPKWGLLVADMLNHVVRAIDLDTANVTTLGDPAGDPDTDALPVLRVQFPYVTSVASAQDGRIFTVSSASTVKEVKIRVIRSDSQNTVVTLAGGAADGYNDGSGTVALMRAQGGALWDGTGLLFSDPGAHRIRRLEPGNDAASSTVQTVAGSGLADMADGVGSSASFAVPLGLWQGNDGAIYLADGGGAIRVLKP